jgi:hypothetical protein
MATIATIKVSNINTAAEESRSLFCCYKFSTKATQDKHREDCD